MIQKDREFNLGEHVINTAFNQIVDKFETVNGDCEVVSKFIKKDYSVLDKVSPRELTKAYEYLSLPLDEKPSSFKTTLEEAFGDFGIVLYDKMDRTNQKDVIVLLNHLESIRMQLHSASPGQKNLFKMS